VNNDIDYVSRRGGAPDTAMAARPGRAVADRTVDALCNNPRLHSAADVERIAASLITVGTPRTKGDCNRTS